MYPRVEQRLDFLDIARDWGRDLPQHPPWEEVFDLLLRAFWRSDLCAVMPGSMTDPRPRLFKAMRQCQSHPGFLIVDLAWERPLPVRRPDGSIQIDIRRPIFWPADPAAQTPEAFEAAYAALGDTLLQDYNEIIRPLLATLQVHRDEFVSFCERKGYALPGFWMRRDATVSLVAPAMPANLTDERGVTDAGRGPAAPEVQILKSTKSGRPKFDAQRAQALLIAEKLTRWKSPPKESESRDFLLGIFNGVPNGPHREIRHKVWPNQIKSGPTKRPPQLP